MLDTLSVIEALAVVAVVSSIVILIRTPGPRARRERLAPAPPNVVRLADLVTVDYPIVSRRSFVDQVLEGPMFLKVMDRNRFEFCSTSSENNFLTVYEGTAVNGAVLVYDCTFIRCYFRGVTFIGTAEDAVIAKAMSYQTVDAWRAARRPAAGPSCPPGVGAGSAA